MSVKHLRQNGPAPEWQHFFAVMTEADLKSRVRARLRANKAADSVDDDIDITTFDVLFAQLGLERSEANLHDIIKNGLMWESVHYFSAEIGRVFKQCADGSDYVQIWSEWTRRTWTRQYNDFFDIENFFELLNDEEYIGCFQITDEQNNWQCKLDDTEPIVYFAVNDKIAAQLIKHAAATAMPLSPDFTRGRKSTIKEAFALKLHNGISATVYGVEIRNKRVVLLDILSVIEGGAVFNWMILRMWALWKSGTDEAAAARLKGSLLTLDELKALAGQWYQEITATFIGSKGSETCMRRMRYENEGRVYVECDWVIQVMDRNLWQIHTHDQSQVERLVAAFKGAARLPELRCLI